LEEEGDVYIKINSTDTAFQGDYKIRVLKARPVILVHGIDSWPWDIDDVKSGNNSMGNWKDNLPWDIQAYPCVCYDFLWNSLLDDLKYINEAGTKITEIIDCSESVNPSIDKLFEKHKMNVAIVAHSMGGYIARYALNEVPEKIYKVATMGSPFYGSDVAFGPKNWWTAHFKRTSEHNLKELMPGSGFVLAMHDWEGKNKCLCFAGYGAQPRINEPLIPYDRGLQDSDGAVPASSALLVGACDNKLVRRNHGTVGCATYMDGPHAGDTHWFIALLSWFNTESCKYRWNKTVLFNDEIYKGVRNYIK